MRAAEAAVHVLLKEGIDTAFGLPGAAINPLYAAMRSLGGINHILARRVEGASHGDGQTCKVANQIIVALTIEAVGEALLFVSKMGADPAKVRQALMGGFASSRILEVHGERMIKRTFDPGFRIELHQKDLNLALTSARQVGISLPNTATAQELFNACAEQFGLHCRQTGRDER
ncbi:MAG: NAD-binding protein [Lysobacterales bacterium]